MKKYEFAEDFIWGVAAGSYQIEENMTMVYPADPNSQNDVFSAKMQNYQDNLLFTDPILKGTYPEKFFYYLMGQGVTLPDIRPGDMELMCQELDFFGMNYYNATYVKAGGSWPLHVTTRY